MNIVACDYSRYQLGFKRAGVIHHAGFMFGSWLDRAFYELRLSTPVKPVDG